MNAGLHKLTAGDGYTYLTRQVAVMDSTQRGASSMNDYYSMKGEAPGRWGGRGLAAFADIMAGDAVDEAQMKSLFGLGQHPDAARMTERIIAEEIAKGAKQKDAVRAATAAIRLGSPFKVYTDATPFRRELAKSYGLFNSARGESSKAAIATEYRERLRTELATGMFTDEVGRAPLPHELSGWLARNDRDKTSAVAGYDITFSPVKSFSVLWAVADRDLRERMSQAHERAVADAVRWLEDNAAFTRTGTNGVAQVDIDGLITTAFTHRDARSGDPDLHTHLVVSNKVRSKDGRWLALDGRPLHRAKVTVSEVYNTALEAHARQLCGLEATDREPTAEGKRAVREFVGVDRELCEVWSTRDREITARFGVLATQFHAAHGREPTPVEAQQLRQQANLETREAKHEPRSAAEQFHTWRTDAARLLGGEHAVAAMVATACNPTVEAGADPRNRDWLADSAHSIIATVSSRRATWQPHHVWAEARRLARASRIPAADVESVCQHLTALALSPPLSVGRDEVDSFVEEPELFRKATGHSVYTDNNTRQYTSWSVLDAEKRLVVAAQRDGGRVAFRPAVEIAILEHAANNPGRELNSGQMMLVRDFALSGKLLQLALAPAGTGKTTAMKVLARAWEADSGHVLGLAPQGSAAGVLQADIGTDTATIDKLIHVLDRVEHGNTNHDASPYFVPDWFAKIGPNSLVVIDEAGMAGTEILDRAVAYLIGAGASVRLIGDDRQQSAVAAGGVVRDIAETAGAVSLSTVMRFRDPAEGAATLALRDGDTAAIGFYLDKGRVHEGEAAAVTDELYRDWSTDVADGRDSIMLAGARDVVRDLNGRARTDRLARLDPDADPGREMLLSDGNSASAGDTVITRRNDSRLRISRTDHVRNGYRWTVAHVRDDGALDIVHKQSGRRTTVPADYVAQHVELGYASTIRTSQGMTTDMARTLFTGIESREAVYVPLSRGRDENHAYVVSALPGDEHSVLTDKARRPDSAVDIFTAMLARDGVQESATTVDREALDPFRRLAPAVDAYVDAVGTAAERVAGTDVMAAIDLAAATVNDGKRTFDLTTESAWPVLRKHLATIAVSGSDPVAQLRDAARAKELDSAYDLAAVLDWRLDPDSDHHQGNGPLPWLRDIPAALTTHSDYGKYLVARRDLVTELADHVRDLATEWTPPHAPRWARALLTESHHTALLGDVAVWRAATSVDDVDRRPTGRERYAIVEKKYQRRLDARFVAVVGDIDGPAKRWAETAQRLDPRITADPYWPIVAQRLTLAHRAGTDVHRLLQSALDPTRPLPAEMAAAALWWRLARSEHLSAAALDPDQAAAGPLRPDWTRDLRTVFDTTIALHIMADPSWPALVAAVESGDPRRFPARALLETASALIHDAQDGARLRPDQYASALAWRISDLIHHTPATVELPPEPVDPDSDIAAAAAAGVIDPTAAESGDLTTAPDPVQPAPLDQLDQLPPDVVVVHEVGHTVDDTAYALSLLALAPPEPEFDEAPTPFDLVVDEPPVEARDVDADGAPGHWRRRSAPVLFDEAQAEERYAQLREEFYAADARVAELRHAVAIDASQHTQAAAPWVVELRNRYDTQRPFAVAAYDAEAESVLAETDAADAKVAHEQAVRAAADARATAGTADSVVTELGDRIAELTPADVRTYLDALELAQQLRIAEIDVANTRLRATSLAEIAAQRRTDADLARRALEHAAGGADQIVSDADLLDVSSIATDLDFAVLHAAYATRAAIRDEWSEVRRAAVTSFAEATAATTPRIVEDSTRSPDGLEPDALLLDSDHEALPAQPDPAQSGPTALDNPALSDADPQIPLPPEPPLPLRPEPLVEPVPARSELDRVDLDELAATMRRAPLRMLRRADLDAQIHQLRGILERPDTTMSGWVRQQAVQEAADAAANLEVEHARLAEQAAAVTQAEQAVNTATDIGNQYQQVAAQLATLRRELTSTAAVRTGTRRRLSGHISNAEQDAARLASQHRAATEIANAHTASAERLGAMTPQWASIIRRAGDNAGLRDELARARAAVDAARDTATQAVNRRAANTAQINEQLAAATAEVQRRRTLPPALRAGEKRIRAAEQSRIDRPSTEQPLPSSNIEQGPDLDMGL